LGRAEYSVDELRRLRRAELLRRLDRLVDRDLVGHIGTALHLVQRDAQDAALERRDPVERPTDRVALDQRVEVRAFALGPLDQLLCERARVARGQLL
jgi:hypothetical protein